MLHNSTRLEAVCFIQLRMFLTCMIMLILLVCSTTAKKWHSVLKNTPSNSDVLFKWIHFCFFILVGIFFKKQDITYSTWNKKIAKEVKNFLKKKIRSSFTTMPKDTTLYRSMTVSIASKQVLTKYTGTKLVQLYVIIRTTWCGDGSLSISCGSRQEVDIWIKDYLHASRCEDSNIKDTAWPRMKQSEQIPDMQLMIAGPWSCHADGRTLAKIWLQLCRW